MAGHGTHVIAVSNGIFEHCEQIGVALWVFLWMLDRTTKEAPGDDGQIEGLVYGGRPIPARDIGNDLQMTVRTVHAPQTSPRCRISSNDKFWRRNSARVPRS